MTAAERILAKALAASGIDSEQWASIHAGLRDRAFFSAKVTEARVLHEMRGLSAQVAAGGLSASEFRDQVRKALAATGYEPEEEDEGTIKDLTTRRRCDLIQQTNVRQARGYVQYLEGTRPGALAAEPCQELIRVRSRRKPRDWERRWSEAGGTFYGHKRMIALKTDPIWSKISRFDNPFPPYDFNSGMGTRGVPRSEALKLGVITDSTPVQTPPETHLNGSLQSEVEGVAPDSEEGRSLKAYFGDQVEIRDGRVIWQEHVLRDVIAGKTDGMELGEASRALLAKIALGINTETARRFKGKGAELAGKTLTADGGLSNGEKLLVPSMWRAPDRVTSDPAGPGCVRLWLDTLDGNALVMTVDPATGIKSIIKTTRKEGANA